MFRNFLRFWSQEHSLTALLVVLIVDLFVLFPMTGGGRVVDLAADLVFSLILLAGLRSMARNKAVRFFFSLFVVLGVVTHFAWRLFDLSLLAGWNSLFSALAVVGMLIVALWMVYQDGPVTGHRVRGAIAAYLLIGVVFAKTYTLINYLMPGAFNIASPATPFAGEGRQAFYYFSIVTLTTVGYGDITAAAPTARSLVMVEALIGQLYPAILLARLVSLSVAARPKE
ncbi:MAG TPA: potassium channel family protein [Thermodesulfovibrionales bacterium]|nr:potassium channel family protein [Thermodesulfovibrionales bacterium]